MGQDGSLGAGLLRSSGGGKLYRLSDGGAWQALDGPCEAGGFGQLKRRSDS